MKYLYQQLIAFWTVIAITFILTGFAFIQLTRHTIEQNNYQQLSFICLSLLTQHLDHILSKGLTNGFSVCMGQGNILHFFHLQTHNTFRFPTLEER